MSYFISIAAIFMAVFALKYFTKSKFEILFPLVNLSIIVMLYLFGMFQILVIGGYIILLSILTLFIIAVVKLFKHSDTEFIKQFFSPLVIIIIIFTLVQFIALKGMRVFSHDELTHWGLVVKNMFYQHNFGGGATATTMFKGYPLGSSLFLYFFEMFGATFMDSYLFMAMNILNISLLLPLIAKFENQKQKITISLILIGVAWIFNYKMFFSIWNDQFLAIAFAFILISYFCFITEKGLPKLNFISMLLATFVLISSKSTGLILALFAYIIIGVNLIVGKRNLIKRNIKSTVLTCVLVLLSILTPKISWSIYLKFIEIGGAWGTNQLTLSNIINYCFNPNHFQSQATKNFLFTLIYPFKNQGNAGSLPLPVVVSVMLILALICMIKKKSNKKECIALGITVFATFIAYIIGLLFSYIFTFDPGEALVAQSFVRYANTYILGIILFLVAYFISYLSQWKSKKYSSIYTSIVASVVVIIGLISCPLLTKLSNKNISQFNQYTSYLTQLSTNDRVYIINSSQDTIKDYLQMRYIATPINTSGLKIGGSPHIGDIWNKNMSIDELTSAIIEGNYNYLYIHTVDIENLQKYESLFNSTIKTKSMYKIVNNNGTLTFNET